MAYATLSTLSFTRRQARLLPRLFILRSVSPQTLDRGRCRTARLRRLSCVGHLPCLALIRIKCYSREQIARSDQNKKGAPLPGRPVGEYLRSLRDDNLATQKLFCSAQINPHIRHRGLVSPAVEIIRRLEFNAPGTHGGGGQDKSVEAKVGLRPERRLASSIWCPSGREKYWKKGWA